MNVKLDRTVRMALWGGEEEGCSVARLRQGTLRRYRNHEAHRRACQTRRLLQRRQRDRKAARSISAGQRYGPADLPGLDEPFRDLGFTTLTIRNTGGTDHLSYDAVGLPGFQFIQDPVEYMSRTHHSNMDVYDRVQKGDLMQAAAIVAAFAYNTAMRDEMLPRKPLPKPQPRRGGPVAVRPRTNLFSGARANGSGPSDP